jgi:hypothetical protein
MLALSAFQGQIVADEAGALHRMSTFKDLLLFELIMWCQGTNVPGIQLLFHGAKICVKDWYKSRGDFIHLFWNKEE